MAKDQLYYCARCGFGYDPWLAQCGQCQLPRWAPWEPLHPSATLRKRPPPQVQPRPQPQLSPTGRPNLDHLWYGGNVSVPAACSCCMGPAQTSVPTKYIRTGGRTAARVQVPYCRACKWHRLWSGHFAVGVAHFLGLLCAGGGIAAGVLLGIALTKDGGNRQGYCGVLAFVFMLLGYAAAMVLVGTLGRFIAPVGPQCAGRGDAVVVTRGRWVWRFHFKNPRFEDAFRGMNHGRVDPH